MLSSELVDIKTFAREAQARGFLLVTYARIWRAQDEGALPQVRRLGHQLCLPRDALAHVIRVLAARSRSPTERRAAADALIELQSQAAELDRPIAA